MKKTTALVSFILLFAASIATLVAFAVISPDYEQDPVAVNTVVQTVTRDFDDLSEHRPPASLDYVVLDDEGNTLYRTRAGLSESINAAVAHRDTVIDVERDGDVVGKVVVYNDGAQALNAYKRTTVAVLAAVLTVGFGICIAYGAYFYRTAVKPFRKLKGFAERVACGNLDIPLEMDRQNIFGAFTESFDLMRSELKKARIAEAEAQRSKKELVAKLSHDIKTPIASIKAVSEVGLAVAANEKDKANYAQIIGKADWINTLVTNLFTATLEELQQLTVAPTHIESGRIKTMLENADYLHRADIPNIPECLIFADALRLQQVFDNIFNNSYKYADTDVAVSVAKDGERLAVAIEDNGGGVPADELPALKEKYKRGGNSVNVEGAGLGLYISDYFMNAMRGELKVENGERGLRITVFVALSGNN